MSRGARAAVAFTSGALFALGLALAGMTRPSKVLAFLDFAGDWDPSLAFVMVGAIGVYAVAARLVLRRPPRWEPGFAFPEARRLDAPLLAGSALFGIGWGLSGYCPGPALTSAAATSEAALFAAAMLGGMLVHHLLFVRRREASDPPSEVPRRPLEDG